MKKFIFVFFSMVLFLNLGNKVFAEDISLNQEKSISINDKEETFPSSYQPDYKPTFLKMLFILIALLTLIFLTFWILKKLMKLKVQQANLTKNIKILEKRILSPKTILYLVEIEGKKVLMSESHLETNKIKDID